MVAYKSLRENKSDVFRKLAEIGKALHVSRAEGTVIVHQYRAVSDGHLRVKWEPVFVDEGNGVVIGTGTNPLKEKIEAKRLITTLVLHDGVINHASARRLDKAGYGTETAAMEVCGAQVQHSLKDEKLERIAALYEVMRGSAGVGMSTLAPHTAGVRPEQNAVGSSRGPQNKVSFIDTKTFQAWLQLKEVDFAEIFRGRGEATVRVREAGLTAAEGFDNKYITYERSWHLDQPGDQADLAWLIVYVL